MPGPEGYLLLKPLCYILETFKVRQSHWSKPLVPTLRLWLFLHYGWGGMAHRAENIYCLVLYRESSWAPALCLEGPWTACSFENTAGPRLSWRLVRSAAPIPLKALSHFYSLHGLYHQPCWVTPQICTVKAVTTLRCTFLFTSLSPVVWQGTIPALINIQRMNKWQINSILHNLPPFSSFSHFPMLQLKVTIFMSLSIFQKYYF